jgi:small subunit ribosomal protein S6
MREYESVFVLDPSVEDAQVDAEVNKIREFLTSRNCEITEVQKWGRRKLAYEVRKNKEGIYTLIRFQGESGVPSELDRRYRLNENMLRFLTVLHEAPPPSEGEDGNGEGAPRRRSRDDDDDDDSDD